MSLSPDALKVLNDFGNESGVTKCHVDQLPEALRLTSAPDATSVPATPAHNGRFMIARPLYALLATLALGACAHTAATPAPATVTETSAMSSSADHVPADPSKGGPRTAQEALERVLELIRTSASIESFTSDHVSRAMGQSVQHRDDGSGRFGASGVLTRNWNYGFGVNKTEVKGAWFEFLFLPNPPEASPSMSDICQIDFEAFASHLEKMGFSRQRNLVEDGRWMSDIFQRPGMRVELFPRGEADEPLARTTHQCVEWVQIR